MKANSASDQLDEKVVESDHHKFELIPRTKEEDKREVLTPFIIKHLKKRRKLVMINAYDAPTAALLDDVGVDIIVVDDLLAKHILGLPTTQNVDIEDMVRHTKAVSSAVKFALVVVDVPYCATSSVEDAYAASVKLMSAGAKAVKIEGNPEFVRFLMNKGIPVLGHVGLLQQTMLDKLAVGNSPEESRKILIDAKAIEMGGAFALFMEAVPIELARSITKQVQIPTIGFASGPDCNGQMLLREEILGLMQVPAYAKQYEELLSRSKKALVKFVGDVRGKKFPTKRFGVRESQTALEQ